MRFWTFHVLQGTKTRCVSQPEWADVNIWRRVMLLTCDRLGIVIKNNCTPWHIFSFIYRAQNAFFSPLILGPLTWCWFSVLIPKANYSVGLAVKVTVELESRLFRGKPHGEADRLFFLGEEANHLNECTCVCPRLIVSIPSCRVRVCGEALLFVTSQPSPIPSMLFCPPTLFFVNHLFMESSW